MLSGSLENSLALIVATCNIAEDNEALEAPTGGEADECDCPAHR